MRAIVQRVKHSSVRVSGETVGEIQHGIMLLAGFGQGDTRALIKPAVQKIINLRIFADAQGRFQHSLLDIKGEILIIPQFTLYADTAKGRRPEFFGALAPTEADRLFQELISEMSLSGVSKVQSGIFGADMQVLLENDGPVTIPLEW